MLLSSHPCPVFGSWYPVCCTGYIAHCSLSPRPGRRCAAAGTRRTVQTARCPVPAEQQPISPIQSAAAGPLPVAQRTGCAIRYSRCAVPSARCSVRGARCPFPVAAPAPPPAPPPVPPPTTLGASLPRPVPCAADGAWRARAAGPGGRCCRCSCAPARRRRAATLDRRAGPGARRQRRRGRRG